MRMSLTPRTTEFFRLFASAGENALEVARLVERRFREHPNSSVTQEQVKAIETAGDGLTRDLTTLLNTQYITPFDREDIYQLATEIDDVVDYLEEASDLLALYGVEMPTRHAVEQCAVIVGACEQLAIACDNLKGMRGVQEALVKVKQLEDEGDRIHPTRSARSSATGRSIPSSSSAGRTSTPPSNAAWTRARRRRTSSRTSSSRTPDARG